MYTYKIIIKNMNKTSYLLASSIITLALFSSGFSIANASNEAKVNSVSSVSKSVIKTGSNQSITWTTENFPAEASININLIKKVSDSPVSYELVRQIAANTENDGSFKWSPKRDELGENLQIEIGCGNPEKFTGGCVSSVDNVTFAVEKSFGANLASLWDAIMSIFSR